MESAQRFAAVKWPQLGLGSNELKVDARVNILVTGSAGFLGGTIVRQAEALGNKTSGLNRSSGEYQVDLSSKVPELEHHFDLVVHCAGKAHSVPRTPEEKQLFYDVNVAGTKNLLAGLRKPPSRFVFISSVAVYGVESGLQIAENHELAGVSPYAKSKIAAESIVHDWGKSNSVPVSILRLPLIVGPDAPGNLGNMIHAIRRGRYVSINGGTARKSMVLADDVAKCIFSPALGPGTYNLTDGQHPSFRELEDLICGQLGRKRPINIPHFVASMLGLVGDVIPKFPISSATIQKMTADLTFDDSRARDEIGWNPDRVVEHFRIGTDARLLHAGST
ncbi:MAG: NAD-dependent epimerase/dehydratase family protein [Planctomycetota bacterium]